MPMMIRKKVLVADNHPVILKFMTQLLTKRGHRVKTAQNGLEALRLLDDYTPDVAFIDLIMPNIGGDKLCQLIRGRPNMEHTHLIILSAVTAEQMPNVVDFGANACIAKGPFPQMAKQVLEALEKNGPHPQQVPPETISGLEDIDFREVTKELLSVKRHLEVIMMSMSEGILELNHESRVIYANPSALSLLNIPEERLLGERFSDLFGQKAREMVDTLARMHASPGPDSPGPCMQLNGKQITIDVSPIRDDENKTIVVLNDITKQKRMEAQLRQAQKMEAIGTLAGGIAHDFNNLLMAIQGTVSLLLFNMDPDHPHHDKLKSIEKHVESGAKLTRQLLGYARKGKYEVKPVDLNRLVRETAETFGRTKKDIAIHVKLFDDLHATEVDEGQIEQVLLNLFLNAAGAMENGGRLSLETKNTTHKELQTDLYKPEPGNYVLLTVSDTGTGMDEKTKARIFEPFFTTKEMGRGTGLGLASAYGIIKSHGGYIEVDSKEGMGTTFKIYLPASKKPFDQHTDKPQEKVATGSETILLVDDERMILEVGRQLLEAMGYEVLTAANGKEAVNIYETQKNDIDLLILDVIMPEMNGSDVYEKMKHINPKIKVLVSSGYSVEGQAKEMLGRGCNGFIQKPFHIGQLSKSIREILQT